MPSAGSPRGPQTVRRCMAWRLVGHWRSSCGFSDPRDLAHSTVEPGGATDGYLLGRGMVAALAWDRDAVAERRLSAGRTGMPLTFAGHEVDLRRQELRRDGSRVHVEPQVFDLLVHLLRHRDRVVSKDELLDEIWSGRIVSEAALSSRINAARKAVGDDGERQSLIKTIHKRGFRFVGEVLDLPEEPVADPAPAPMPAAEPAAAEPSPRPSVVVLPFANLSA